jgi:hypothetical protein
VKLARFRKSKAICFLSYVEYRPSTNTTNLYIHTHIYRTHTQKQDWKRRLRDKDKKESKLVKNNEIYHICIETKHYGNTPQTVQKHRIRARTCMEGGYIMLSATHIEVKYQRKKSTEK